MSTAIVGGLDRTSYRAKSSAARKDTHQMLEARRDNIRVVYSEPSQGLVKRIFTVCTSARRFLAPLYGLPPDHPIKVNWVSKARYRGFTGLPYGFPSNNSRLGEILPAADLDLPSALVGIVDLLDLEGEGSEGRTRFAELLGLRGDCKQADILDYLNKSKEFYCRYLIHFILPHEIVHAFNIAGNTPVRPNWLHEWQAQFGAILACRASGRDADAELFELYYRMMYRGGKSQVEYRSIKECSGKGTQMSVQNYAWYHGALVEMFCRLEQEYGPQTGELILNKMKELAHSRKAVSDTDVIAVAGCALNANLAHWFQEQWGIR